MKDTGEDEKGELFWTLNDDVLALGVPANYVVIVLSLEESVVLRDRWLQPFFHRRQTDA